MSNPKVVRGVIKEKVVLREGEVGKNFNGGSYDELQYILRGEDGKLYVSYWSSADFDFCPLTGNYTDCSNCNWWWERILPLYCEDCHNRNCQECITNFYSCQHPDLVLIETERWIFRARPLED